MGCASQERKHVCPDAHLLLQAVERAEEYHRTICQLSAELAQLQEEKLALCEEVVALKEECRAAAIQADTQASALGAIQPLLEGALDAQEGPVSCLLTHPSHEYLWSAACVWMLKLICKALFQCDGRLAWRCAYVSHLI